VQASKLYETLEEQYFGENMQEREEIERLPELLRRVSVFVDVGASLGQYSFFANRFLKNASIYCVEADPVRVLRLGQLAAEWSNASSNTITVIHAAAADTDGKVKFYRTDANLSGALFLRHAGGAESVDWEECEVACVTLDGLLKNVEPDLIKIDVEGSEFRVLQGAREILTRGHSRFLVEVHPWNDASNRTTPSDVFKLFAQFDYDFRRTHRHWLFEKSNQPLKRRLKSTLVIFTLEHPWLKSAAKNCVLKLNAMKRHFTEHKQNQR
jgi:FkbM family methyltransferase